MLRELWVLQHCLHERILHDRRHIGVLQHRILQKRIVLDTLLRILPVGRRLSLQLRIQGLRQKCLRELLLLLQLLRVDTAVGLRSRIAPLPELGDTCTRKR